MNLVFLAEKHTAKQSFFTYFLENSHSLSFLSSDSTIHPLLRSGKIEAVIAEEENLPVVTQLIAEYPMVNFALISAKPADIFHQLTEGYGIFMQLPLYPGHKDAAKMLEKLEHLHVQAAHQKGITA